MDLLQGTLDMLVLRTLVLAPLHGYGIAKAIRSNSSEALDIEFGSLYPALKRLEPWRCYTNGAAWRPCCTKPQVSIACSCTAAARRLPICTNAASARRN